MVVIVTSLSKNNLTHWKLMRYFSLLSLLNFFFLLSQYFWKEQFDTLTIDVIFSGQRFAILAMFYYWKLTHDCGPACNYFLRISLLFNIYLNMIGSKVTHIHKCYRQVSTKVYYPQSYLSSFTINGKTGTVGGQEINKFLLLSLKLLSIVAYFKHRQYERR